MNTNCRQCSVPHHGNFEAFGPAGQAWRERLTTGLSRNIRASGQILEHLEEEILHPTRDMQRSILEKAQKKAEETPPVCPVCAGKSNRLA